MQFPPDEAALEARLLSVDPKGYAATRNHLSGSVTHLSPYLTHGFLSLGEVLQTIRTRTVLVKSDKLFVEFAWREFFQHVRRYRGKAIFENLRAPVCEQPYAEVLPSDIREGRTGIAAIDQSVSQLYRDGYLHNHARMWLASYVVHYRRVAWRVGADWMYGHLLDGDLASNHLSWQWVAGTFSSKPYIFNAGNVEKYAPASWHCRHSPLDTTYEALELLARGQNDALSRSFENYATHSRQTPAGVVEPTLYAAPPRTSANEFADANAVRQATAQRSEVELVHSWGLRRKSLAPSTAKNTVFRLGVIDPRGHTRFPWSAARWSFVLDRMREICDLVYLGCMEDLLNALPAGADLYSTLGAVDDDTQAALSNLNVRWLQPAPLVEEPPRFCQSFSRYFKEVDAR